MKSLHCDTSQGHAGGRGVERPLKTTAPLDDLD